MVTTDNITTLRRAAYRSQSRRTDEPRTVVILGGGPLDGIRLSVTKRESVSWRLGFCSVTDTGPVQVLYSDAGDGLRVFESVTKGGKLSGSCR